MYIINYVCIKRRNLPLVYVFSLSGLPCVQEAEDHAGRRHSVHLYQHAFQSHGPEHPTRHQGAAGAYAGCGPQVGENEFITMINN